MKRLDAREAVEVEFRGRRFSGTFTTSTGMVHVISPFGRRSTQFTGAAPDSLARTLLMEILREADAAGILR